MFRIAMCDDDLQDLQFLQKNVEQWLKDKMLENGKIRVFHKASELRASLEQHRAHYELFILDILMPDINGIDLGRLIRSGDEKVPVIYTSSSPEYALDAYGIYAVRYLKKPLDEKELRSALDFAYMVHCSSGNGEEKHRLLINGKTGVSSIFMEDIMYIENSLRCITYTMENGEDVISIRRSGSFEEAIFPVLDDEDFLQVHKSFVVNMNYIRQLQADMIVMEDERRIPLARRRMNDVRERYIRFVNEGRGGC